MQGIAYTQGVYWVSEYSTEAIGFQNGFEQLHLYIDDSRIVDTIGYDDEYDYYVAEEMIVSKDSSITVYLIGRVDLCLCGNYEILYEKSTDDLNVKYYSWHGFIDDAEYNDLWKRLRKEVKKKPYKKKGFFSTKYRRSFIAEGKVEYIY